MNLQQKYAEAMSSKGENMMTILSNLSEVESKYINARIIIEYLEKDLILSEAGDTTNFLKSPEYIKKQISDWKQLVNDLESKQHLAAS